MSDYGHIGEDQSPEAIAAQVEQVPRGVKRADPAEYLPAAPTTPVWNFWLPDEDVTAGWTNHCYILQFVCQGVGATPAEAWLDAKREDAPLGVPEHFVLPDKLVAIRDDAEVPFTTPEPEE